MRLLHCDENGKQSSPGEDIMGWKSCGLGITLRKGQNSTRISHVSHEDTWQEKLEAGCRFLLQKCYIISQIHALLIELLVR